MAKEKVKELVTKKHKERLSKVIEERKRLSKEKKKQQDIIKDAGRGSRRTNTARKMLSSIEEKQKKVEKQWDRSGSQALKDYRLVSEYGESAMEARGFGTERGEDYSMENRTGQKLHKLQSTPKAARKQKKATGGSVKKYAKGGSVNKAWNY